jgi:transposase
MGRRREYTSEFKESALELYHRGGGKTRKEIAERLGISPENMRRWLREEKEGKTKNIRVFPGRGYARNEKLFRLRKENEDLRESNEILKKSDSLLCSKDPAIAAYRFMNENHERHGVAKMTRE